MSVKKSNIQLNPVFSIWLDNLRGVCSLVVLAAHIDQIYIIPVVGIYGYYPKISLLVSTYAVALFFVMSGFVITLSILKNIERNGFFEWSEFYLARIARLYPPLICGLLLALSVYVIIHFFNLHGSITWRMPGDLYAAREQAVINWWAYLVNFLLLQGFVENWRAISLNGSLWSLGHEYWLYILAMCFALWIRGRNKVFAFIAFFGLLLYLFLSANYKFICLGFIWAAGSVLALIYIYQKQMLKQVLFIAPVFMLTMLVAWLCIKVQPDAYIPYRSNKALLFQLMIVVGSSVVFTYLAIRYQWGKSLISVRYLQPTAKYSYTLYIIHYPLLLLSYSFMHATFHTGILWRQIIVLLLLVLFIPWIASKIAPYIENSRYFKRKIANLFLICTMKWNS